MAAGTAVVRGHPSRRIARAMLLRMRSSTLMVRRRFFSAVSNHEARGPSFETRAKSALLRMRSEIASHLSG
jgi:hypothetical protein